MAPHSASLTNNKISVNPQKDLQSNPTIKTVDVLVGAPPSYKLLYGGQKSKASPTASIYSPSSIKSITPQENLESITSRRVSCSNNSAQLNVNEELETKNNTSSHISPSQCLNDITIELTELL